jgi:Domain of unknown function (DUF1918)
VDAAGRNATGAIGAGAAPTAGVSGYARPRPGTDSSEEDHMDTNGQKTEAGDIIVISGHRVGETERSGEILEVIGAPPHERYRVRWEDAHESVFYPGSDATIRHSARRTSKRRS